MLFLEKNKTVRHHVFQFRGKLRLVIFITVARLHYGSGQTSGIFSLSGLVTEAGCTGIELIADKLPNVFCRLVSRYELFRET